MAETLLSDAELARMRRDLDHLVMPDFETIRALLAETVASRAEISRLSAVIARIGLEVERAQAEAR